MSNWKIFTKCILTLLLGYQLIVISLSPNPHSIVAKKWGSFFSFYANTFFFNSSWSFFSPRPAPNMMLEYELVGADFVDDYQFFKKEKMIFSHKQRRLVYFLLSVSTVYHDYFRPIFKSYLCNKHPLAESFSLKALAEERPSFQKAKIDSYKTLDPSDMKIFRYEQFDCVQEEGFHSKKQYKNFINKS